MKRDTNLFDIVDEFFYNHKDCLKNVSLIASQHILKSQGEMFKRLLNFGLSPRDTYIIGKNYSTNIDIFTELYNRGFTIEQSSLLFNADQAFDEVFLINMFIE